MSQSLLMPPNPSPQAAEEVQENAHQPLGRYLAGKILRKQKEGEPQNIDVLGSLPFIGMHGAALMIFFTGFSWVALAACVLLYVVRMFAITGGFHRYFSHRTYKTSRWFQFCLAWLGTMSAQLGPLWWAAHHRHHHRHSDTEEDIHSPGLRGFFWAHMGWIMCRKFEDTNFKEVRDLMKFPELLWINRFHWIPVVALAVSMFGLGVFLNHAFPSLGTSGMQMLAWGFFLSTVLLYHGTFFINSLAHVMGTRRFRTGDDSRNSFLLALITLGEGWHNNHHRYPGSERQGMYWWEVDITHYILRMLEKLGIVWELRTHPAAIFAEAENATLDGYRR